jgi:ribonuclease P protein component
VDFQAASRAKRVSAAGFLLQMRRRDATETPGEPDERVGFTVTRKIGGAVERNRIRRRLKAAVAAVPPDIEAGAVDWVLVARREAISLPFPVLVREAAGAFRRALQDRGPARSSTKANLPAGQTASAPSVVANGNRQRMSDKE